MRAQSFWPAITVVMAAAGLLGSCWFAGTAAEPTSPSAKPAPQIDWVPEMEPFGDDFPSKEECTPAQIESFDREWRRVRDAAVKEVTAEALAGISRWAVAKTRGFTPPDDWISKLPMRPIGRSTDKQRILFGQETKAGIPLPTDFPHIVFRRLLLRAVYDLESRTITKVYITIRGWREE